MLNQVSFHFLQAFLVYTRRQEKIGEVNKFKKFTETQLYK